MTIFESRLSNALKQSRAGTEKGPTVFLAAVSGGADSTAMLAGLAALREEAVCSAGAAGFSLHCVHVEHGIRPAEESRGDARAVEALCEKLDVPCKVVTIPAGRIAAFAGKGGPGIEGAARIFRYRALNAEAKLIGACRILTAHTIDDLLENLLMRILKGAGPAGLAPMPKARGRIFRPLLDITRQDVLAYLEEKGLSYRTDSTNADTRFFRNQVRLKLVPFLDGVFPFWRKTIMALAETQSLTAEFLAAECRKRLPWEREGELLKMKEEDFYNAPAILREEALFVAADMIAGQKLSLKSRKPVPKRTSLRCAASNAAAKHAAQDLGPVRLERKDAYITVSKAFRGAGERGFSLLIKEPGLYTLKGKAAGFGKNGTLTIEVRAGIEPETEGGPQKTAAFHAGFPLVLRTQRAGDRILRGGHKHRLSDILEPGIRSLRRGVITACDAEGPLAFVAVDQYGELTVIARDKSGAQEAALAESAGSVNANGFFFEFGGLDV